MRNTYLYNLIEECTPTDGKTYELDTPHDFDEMLISWNGRLEASEKLEIRFELFSMGAWSQTFKLMRVSLDEGKASFGIQSDTFGTLKIDLFEVERGVRVEKIRVHLILSDKNASASVGCAGDVTQGLYISCLKRGAQSIGARAFESVHDREAYRDLACFMPAPPMVQYPVEHIGRRICSPTTCVMAMHVFGLVVEPEAFAAEAYDNSADMYGNWPLNMAAVSQYGLRAVARHFSGLSDMVSCIRQGKALAVSVRTGQDNGFTGALQSYPSGHLMLVTGFIKRNGTWYAMVNDPADFEARTSQRLYPVEELVAYWSGIGYEIGQLAPERGIRGDQIFDSIEKWMPGIFVDLRYAGKDNIFGSPLYSGPLEDYKRLRIGTLKKLAHARVLLEAKGYTLKIWDAYRPLSVQKKLWDICPDEKFVANPETGSTHNRGCAVDCTLVALSGAPVSMPSDFDDFSEFGRRDGIKASPAARAHVEILHEALNRAGFESIEDEWWHFHDSDWKHYDIV